MKSEPTLIAFFLVTLALIGFGYWSGIELDAIEKLVGLAVLAVGAITLRNFVTPAKG